MGRATSLPGNRVGMRVYPHHLVRASPWRPEMRAWSRALHALRRPPELGTGPDAFGRAELVLDFGTELDGGLELDITVPGPATLSVFFGESIPEAEGLLAGRHPAPQVNWSLPGRGRHRKVFDSRGFRFLRLVFHDPGPAVVIHSVVVHAEFTFRERDGGFTTSDRRFQRVWETSVYTARLCARPDSIWDGVRRDRHGWYGDARVTQETLDSVYFDPRPAETMLLALKTDSWANGIPNYSFDAVAMLRQLVLAHGTRRRALRDAYGLVRKLLGWVRRTQTNRQGFVVLTDAEIWCRTGFLDWSLTPIGGRFEELSWLQCKYLEALRNAADLARWLGRERDAAAWTRQAEDLHAHIVKAFWRPGLGFVHTLNHVGTVDKPLMPAGNHQHYPRTYEQKIRLGPSGPSRQCNALAVWAGACTPEMRRTVLRRVFDNRRVPAIITPYFAYFEQIARAECGDPAGAVMRMRDYVGELLEREDSPTVWEMYDLDVRDHRRYYCHYNSEFDWTVSHCHGWSSGAVALATRYVAGVRPVLPGFRAVSLDPCAGIPWAFQATVPTPYGPIRALREKSRGPVVYWVPRGITVERSAEGDARAPVVVERG